MRYSDEVIEEVRARNDVVDVIGGYIHLQKKEATILDCVRFTMKSHRHFQCHHRNRCIIALDVEKAEMLSRLSWTMKMKVFRRQLRRWQKELESSCRKRKKAKRAEGRQIIEVFYLPYKKNQHVIFTISL